MLLLLLHYHGTYDCSFLCVFQKTWSSGSEFDGVAALKALRCTLGETKDKFVQQWAGVELQRDYRGAKDTHDANIKQLNGTTS